MRATPGLDHVDCVYAQRITRFSKPLGEFRSVVKDTKSNTKHFTKSISIHSDYQSVHFWYVPLSRLFIITEDLDTRAVTNYKKPVGRY